MKIARAVTATTTVLLFTAVTGNFASGASPALRPIAFIDVNVVPMDSAQVLLRQTVIVRGDKITDIGNTADVAIPGNARRVPGAGRYLLPGLADMHVHLADKDGPARAELLLYLATGVTLVRNMRGSDAHLDYRRRVAGGEWLGPRIFTTTNLLDGPTPVWPDSITVSDPAQVPALVAGFVRDGYDQIKVYNELPRTVYAALADSAAQNGIKIVGHVPFSIGIDAALAAGQYSIEHLRGYDFDAVRPQALVLNGGRNAERFSSWQRMSDDRRRDLVRKTVQAKAWNCPTFVTDDMGSSSPERRRELASNPLVRYLPPEDRPSIVNGGDDALFPEEARKALRESVPKRYQFLKMLSDAGTGLLIGTDSNLPFLIPGFTAIDEMQHFVNAGLTPYQALRAATSEPARFLGISAGSGTIGKNKRADLLLVDANPLDDIQNLWRFSGVMVNGNWLSKSELYSKLDELARSYH